MGKASWNNNRTKLQRVPQENQGLMLTTTDVIRRHYVRAGAGLSAWTWKLRTDLFSFRTKNNKTGLLGVARGRLPQFLYFNTAFLYSWFALLHHRKGFTKAVSRLPHTLSTKTGIRDGKNQEEEKSDRKHGAWSK